MNDYENERIARYVKGKARAMGIRVVLDHKNKFLDGDISVGSEAYFRDDGVIKVSTLHPDWALNLLHEFSHGEQWKSNCPVWRKSYMMGSDAYDIADQWIKGERELTMGQRYDVFHALYDVERDAEARTINHMRRAGSSQCTARYAQRAWAYINSYMYSCFIREWLPAHLPPYSIDSIVDRMPQSMSKELVLIDPSWWKLYMEAYPSLNKPKLSWAHQAPGPAEEEYDVW